MHRHANRPLDHLYLLTYENINNKDEIRKTLQLMHPFQKHTHKVTRSHTLTHTQTVCLAAVQCCAQCFLQTQRPDITHNEWITVQPWGHEVKHLNDQCFRSRFCLWLCVYTPYSLSDNYIHPASSSDSWHSQTFTVCFRGGGCLCGGAWNYSCYQDINLFTHHLQESIT